MPQLRDLRTQRRNHLNQLREHLGLLRELSLALGVEHCAVDLGGRKSRVCIRANDGSIVHESFQDTLALGEFFRERPKSRVVVETCAESFAVADAALMAGHEVRVVPLWSSRSAWERAGPRRIAETRRC